MNPISYIDRATGKELTESVMGNSALRFAYETATGRALWCFLFGSSIPSRLMGAYYDSSLSKKAIASLANIPGCRPDEAEFPPEHYRSFNDFFIRKLKKEARPFDSSADVLVSPGDGRMLVYPEIASDAPVPVKGAKRSIAELCGGDVPECSLAVAILRLAPIDYHRFHFPCDCVQKALPRGIPGRYHSVNPIALRRRPDLFVENARRVTVLNSGVFGEFRMIEVGAFGVGSIVETSSPGEHRKMDEKGYFKFGGSTTVLVFPSDKVKFDADLLSASGRGIEVFVRCGNKIAISAEPSR